MSLEIFVSAGNIEKAIRLLRRGFEKDLYRDLQRHMAFESRGQRKRRKIRQSIRRKRKEVARRNGGGDFSQ